MGLPDFNIIPDSFFRPKTLQIKEAKKTNNQAELAATTPDSEHKSTRTKTNPILHGFNNPVTSWIRKDE